MPTSLPVKRKRSVNLFALFVIIVGISFFVIEIIDPAPMESQASSIASP